MGLHDRDYMKAGAAPRAHWSPHRVTWTIIIVNGLLWFLFSSAAQSAHADEAGLFHFFFNHLMLWPQRVFGEGQVWQLFTSFWLHDWGGAEHVLFNMLALFFFGRAAEMFLGTRRYLVLYLGAGLFASLVYTGWSALAGNVIPALGASGAVFAVLVWVACERPHATVYLMMVIPMPMWLAVGVFMVGMQFLLFAGIGGSAGTAVAHLGGAAFGGGYWLWLRHMGTLHVPGGWMQRQRKGRQQFREGKSAEEVLIRLRMEELLDKISREGIGALSPEEKAFLEEASRRYM